MQDRLREFFQKRPVQELTNFTEYLDYNKLFKDILTPENQENLPKSLNEINAYRTLYGNERTFRKLDFDYDNLGVDLKDYFDVELYTKHFIDFNDITEKDIDNILATTNPNIFEEIEQSMKDIPFLQTMRDMTTRRVKDTEERDIDDLEYLDDEDLDYDDEIPEWEEYDNDR